MGFLFYELDEFGFNLYGGGDVVWQLDKHPLDARALQLLQETLVAVERPPDDSYLTANHVGSDLVGHVVARVVGTLDCLHEVFHVGISHGHGRAVAVAQEPVLQRRGFCDYRVEVFARVMCKQQILHERNADSRSLAVQYNQFPHHGCENFYSHVGQHFVGRQFCIAPLQVSQYKPMGYF